MASDRFGRRSILIFGPLGLAITMFGFGASTEFLYLVMFRLLQGVFNGNMGPSIIRNMIITYTLLQASQKPWLARRVHRSHTDSCFDGILHR